MSGRAEAPSLAAVVDGHRTLVCVGPGGVGKTTVAAGLALAGALRGRRTMVLTIDPARQLARSLGMSTLGRGGERLSPALLASAGLALKGELHAAMLDEKASWDAFISRHAPNPEVRDTLLKNSFYQRLSTSFAGSTEFMAMEELCRLDESGEFDLMVIDTPPAANAIDFLRAPERIATLLDPAVAGWFAHGEGGSGPRRALEATARFAVRQLEKGLGAHAMRDVSAFFVALDALFGDVAARAARARALLASEQTAFVLVSAPKPQVLVDASGLAAAMQSFGAHLRATVINRVHPLPAGEVSALEIEAALGAGALSAADPPTLAWLRETWRSAQATSRAEQDRLRPLAAALPSDAAWVEVPELDHDAHSLKDLAELVALLGLR